MNLDVNLRTTLADQILRRLVAVAPGSEAVLRGSLAEQCADQYSDIDVRWEIPDQQFQPCVDSITSMLSAIRPIESLRADPDFQRSAKRRLFFIRFADVPLFWRVDLDVFATSVGRDPSYDLGNPAAQGSTWSVTESALANAVAAVKAHARGNEDEAHQLLMRAYARVGLTIPQLPVRDVILRLTDDMPRIDPTTGTLARRIKALVAEMF